MSDEPSTTLGARVNVVGKGVGGVVRFIGEADFAPGKWIGLELDEPKGKVWCVSQYVCSCWVLILVMTEVSIFDFFDGSF